MPRKILLTNKDIDSIIQCYLEPNSIREVSKRFKLDRKIITRVLKDSNIHVFSSVCRFTDSQINNIIADYNKPTSIKDVAKKYNCSQSMIYNILVRNNVPFHTKKISNEIKSKTLKCTRKRLFDNDKELSIISFYLEPHSIRETSSKFNCSKTVVCRILKQYNITFHDKCVIRNIKQIKSEETCYKKFGVNNFFKTTEHKNYMKCHNKEIHDKKYNTMRLNNTFNSSNPEKDFVIFLDELYKKDDIIQQYSDSRYPFNCDFYIKSLDLFIELNLHWTHGYHPFNKANEKDLEKLKIWESKNTKYYRKAIKTWTEKDVEKQKVAKEKNLNYYAFYSLDDAYNTIKNIYKGDIKNG